MPAQLPSSLLLTAEEHAILAKANASFSGNIEKCFNVSFSSSERERCAAPAIFSPCPPTSLIASDFNEKEAELNRTKGRLDALDLSVWSQAVGRYKLTGGINADVRRRAYIRIHTSSLTHAYTPRRCRTHTHLVAAARSTSTRMP
jgi:hypothetical protein